MLVAQLKHGVHRASTISIVERSRLFAAFACELRMREICHPELLGLSSGNLPGLSKSPFVSLAVFACIPKCLPLPSRERLPSSAAAPLVWTPLASSLSTLLPTRNEYVHHQKHLKRMILLV